MKLILSTLFLVAMVGCGGINPPPPPPIPTPSPSAHKMYCPQLTCNGQGCKCIGSTKLCKDYQCGTDICECDF